MHCALRFLLTSVLAAAAPAMAEPAHYVVLEFSAGEVVPVYYRQVELAVERDAAVPAVDAAAAGRIRWRAASGRMHEVAMPHVVRAEFARDPESPTSAIDAVDVPDHPRSFVVRAPVADGGVIELELPGGTTRRIDLAALATEADALPLAGRVPTVARRAPRGGDPANRLDVLVFGDGYTAGQQALFDGHAAALRTGMFGITPYREYEGYVNWIPAFVVSQDVGATHPPYQAGCTSNTCCADISAQSDPLAGQVSSTAFGSRFCAYQIHRLLVANNSLVLAAASAYPDWDVVLVSVNDPVYGGSGGQVGVLSQHPAAQEVTIHEFGHTFTGLADEYDSPYPGYPACSDLAGPSPCEANATNQTLAAAVKWRDLFTPGIAIPTPAGTPGTGLFEGARYQTIGMYRPADQCEMRQLGVEFCSVCRQEYVKQLYRGGWGVPANGIDPIEPGSESPVTTQPVVYTAGSTQVFMATVLEPGVGAHEVQWWLDGSPIAGANQASFTFEQATTTPATRTLELRVVDPTALVAPSMAQGLLDTSRSWAIEVVESDVIFTDGFELP